ncbi:MAG: Rieske (2Fe-2S) protein [Polyangiales bacterium]
MGQNEFDRRRALIVLGAVTPCFFGCVAPPVDSSIDNVDNPHDPDDGEGGTTDNPSNPGGDPSGPPGGGDDAGGTAADAAALPEDCGSGTATDSGATTKSDSGTSTKTDSGSSTGGGGGGTTPTCPTTLTDAGATSSFPVNTWKKVTATRPFILGHDAGGYYAFSAKCTHHTSVTIGSPNSSGATTCPSHGAQFDANGNVTRGPASLPLVHYAVTVCGGRIYVDTGKTVAASTRA